MAEGAGIDFTFKVQGDELVAVVNEQVIALGKLKGATDGATASTEALAKQSEALEQAQQRTTESSGRLNRSLAGQLTALSRLQGGVAGLLPQLASWTYLIRRLAIASRGFLSMNPEWLILAGAITAVGGAFSFITQEAQRALDEMRKVYAFQDKINAKDYTARLEMPQMRREAQRMGDTKSVEEIDAEIKKRLEDARDVQEQIDSAFIGEYMEALRLQSLFRLVKYGDPNRPLTTGEDFALDIFPQMRYALAQAGKNADDVGTGLVFFKNPLEDLFEETAKEIDENVKKLEEQGIALVGSRDKLNAFATELEKARVEAEQRESNDAIDADLREGAELLAKRREENEKLEEQANKLLAGNEVRFRVEKDRETGNLSDVEVWLGQLQSEQTDALKTIREFASNVKAEREGRLVGIPDEDRADAREAMEGYNARDALIRELTSLRDTLRKLDETIEDKFSIFEKTWGGENEIESHGGRITDYDPYGGLSYSLNTTDLERRQLEAQQSIQRGINQIATEGTTIRFG